jgi:hypothetical protein
MQNASGVRRTAPASQAILEGRGVTGGRRSPKRLLVAKASELLHTCWSGSAPTQSQKVRMVGSSESPIHSYSLRRANISEQIRDVPPPRSSWKVGCGDGGGEPLLLAEVSKPLQINQRGSTFQVILEGGVWWRREPKPLLLAEASKHLRTNSERFRLPGHPGRWGVAAEKPSLLAKSEQTSPNTSERLPLPGHPGRRGVVVVGHDKW